MAPSPSDRRMYQRLYEHELRQQLAPVIDRELEAFRARVSASQLRYAVGDVKVDVTVRSIKLEQVTAPQQDAPAAPPPAGKPRRQARRAAKAPARARRRPRAKAGDVGARREAIMTMLRDADGPLRPVQIAEALGRAGQSTTSDALQQTLRGMIEDGLLERVDGIRGHYGLATSAAPPD